MIDDDEDIVVVPINNDLERRIAEAFEIFDHAGNKTIDIREVGTILRGLGCCPTEAEVQELSVTLEDPETPGTVHLLKFLPVISQIITEHRFEPASPEELLEAFYVLDPDKKGYITKEHISTLMTEDGEPFTQDELDEMMEIAIDPHTQTVPYEYYINQLMYEPKKQRNIYSLADKAFDEEKERLNAAAPPKRMKDFDTTGLDVQ